MAGQCDFRFLDFIFDPNWFVIHKSTIYLLFRFHDVDQQWDWTFPHGYVTI